MKSKFICATFVWYGINKHIRAIEVQNKSIYNSADSRGVKQKDSDT